jgi:valyl-tRNA synthetase
VDPSTDAPPGYTADRRGVPGGFVGDPDVMDTWATSSLTPQIAGHWLDDPDLFDRVFPMDLRPQAHEIIRTWLFYTVVRSHYEHDALPWSNAAISGFVTDPDRKKISKSKGNAQDEPTEVLAEYGPDAVRYWAAGGRPGQDTIFDRNVFKVGRRLAIKLLNASKFTLSLGEPPEGAAPEQPLDRALLAGLANVVDAATEAFEQYDYTKALEVIEPFFWEFCDDHLELVKGRAYGAFGDEPQASALVTLRAALDVLLRLFAPFLPFVTEEVWSWWKEGSVHRAPWPESQPLRDAAGDVEVRLRDVAAEVLRAIRKAKSDAKVSMRAEVASICVRGPSHDLVLFWEAEKDISDAGKVVGDVATETADELSVEVKLATSTQ